MRADDAPRALLNWIIGFHEGTLGNSRQICHTNQEWCHFPH